MPLTLNLRICSLASLAVMLVASVAAQPNKPAAAKDASEAGEPLVISPHYLRMLHPNALALLAKQVKSGGGDRAQLERLAGPSFAAKLLGADLSLVQVPEKRGKQTAKLALGANLLRSLQLPTQLSPEDYAPKQLDYEKMVPDVIQSGNVYVTSPIEGTVTVSVVATGSTKSTAPFYYTQMQSYTGVVKNGQYVVDQTTAAPTMPIKSGQMFTILMQFGADVGVYTADLHVNCSGPSGSWSAVVPMKLNSSHANDYSVQMVGYNPHVAAFPGRPFNVSFTVKPVNFRKPFFVFVKAPTSNGLAESTDPVATQFYVKSNAQMTVTIPCTCASNAKIQDFVDFTQMLVADNNRSSVVFT
ncbi:MAG TPA: hypothetical protein VKT78_10120, partial [Fimbriimonadaceae bacterium]|nr:hypothetical protein [Fimbriimonadaceae bacterium]